MKYKFKLTLTVMTQSDDEGTTYDGHWIDVAEGFTLTELLGKFLIILASVHHRLIDELQRENRVIDDDIPF